MISVVAVVLKKVSAVGNPWGYGVGSTVTNLSVTLYKKVEQCNAKKFLLFPGPIDTSIDDMGAKSQKSPSAKP